MEPGFLSKVQRFRVQGSGFGGGYGRANVEVTSPVGCISCTITKFVGVATGWLESMTWEFAEIEMVRKTHPTLLNGARRSVRGSLYTQYSYLIS